MALLKTKRFDFHADWTLSKLFINDVLDGFIVEDEIRAVKVHGETAIDAGTYPLGFRYSPKFSASFLYSDKQNILIENKEKSLPKYAHIKDWREHDLIWVMNIPRHKYVLIHWGNSDEATDGCLIVGKTIGPVKGEKTGKNKMGVQQSRAYYKALYCKIFKLIEKGGQQIIIE